MQKITPCLWFDNNAEEAMNFYTSVFKDGKIVSITRYPAGGEGPMAGMDGKVLTGIFELAGQRFMCLDGGPIFKFNESVSFAIDCADQAEVDYFWEKLTEGGSEQPCGWLKDKFGLSWQVVPKAMGEMMSAGTPEQAKRVMDRLMPMKKIDIAALQAAYEGK